MLVESGKIGSFGPGFTYGVHPVAHTVAIYAECNIVGHVARVSPAFLEGLKTLESHP